MLTPGQAHDLVGADALLPQVVANTVIADTAYDADARVLEPLTAAGKTAVIPPKSTRKIQREYDRKLYKLRHLIEIYQSCNLRRTLFWQQIDFFSFSTAQSAVYA